MIDLDEIERRANAATPGPWTGKVNSCVEAGEEAVFETGCGCCTDSTLSEENAAFIAAARTDVPALIARVRELEAESRRFRDWYRNAFGGPSKRETPWDPCACDECESLRRLKEES